MNLVFLGPPGSGKGTQARILAEKCGMLHVSTGDLIREEIASQSEVGIRVEKIVANGGYLSDDIILEMVSKLLASNKNTSLIFDGFPRTMNQVVAFDSILGVEMQKVDIVIDFNINDDVLLDRLAGRITCQDCKAVYHQKSKRPTVEGICDECGSSNLVKRADDEIEVIKNRLRVYQEQTLPISKHYADAGLLKVVNADQSLDKVGDEICRILNGSDLSL